MTTREPLPVFEPTGEVRPPRKGEFYRTNHPHDGIVYCDFDDFTGERPIYRRVFRPAPPQLEEIARLREALRAERDDLRARMKDRTHYEGCEEAHPMCAALARMDAALAASPAAEGRGKVVAAGQVESVIEGDGVLHLTLRAVTTWPQPIVDSRVVVRVVGEGK